MSEEKKRGRPRKPMVRVDVGEHGVRRRVIGGPSHAREPKPKIDRAQPPPRNSDVDAVIARMEAAEARKRASKPKGARKGKPEVPPHLRTTVDKVENPYAAVGGVVRVEVRNSLDVAVRRLKCERGEHVRLFVYDWELVSASLRSVAFDAAGGGSAGLQAFPAAKVDAARRLADLRKMIGEERYTLCVAYLCHGLTVQKIHAAGGEQHVVVSAAIRDAVNSLAEFYSPGRVRPNRTHAAVTRLLAELERTV